MTHWYPVAREIDGRVPHRWYFGWALYVNRFGYRDVAWKIALVWLALVVGGFFLPPLRGVSAALATVALVSLAWSINGHWLIYGEPGLAILRRALALADSSNAKQVADLHVGAWRIT